MFRFGVILALLVVLAAAPQARAQANANPPGKLTYQGFLTDLNGVPLGNSQPLNTNVIFRIYTATTGGTLKWAEQQTVTIDKGHFSVLLGEGAQNASDYFTNNLTSIFGGSDASDRYMDITVGGTTIAPRMQFLPAPYAMLARSANQVVDSTGYAVVATNTALRSGGNIFSGSQIISSDAPLIFSRTGGTGTNGYLASVSAAEGLGPNTTVNDLVLRAESRLLIQTGTNTAMTIIPDPSFPTLFQPRIGIGTTNPTRPLTLQTRPNNTGFLHTDGVAGLSTYVGSSFGYASVGTDTPHNLWLVINRTRTMTLTTNGNVLIGSFGASFSDSYRLEVDGLAHRIDNSSTWTVTSDRRLKRDIESIHGALEVVDQVRPVSFHYSAENRAKNPGLPATKQFGIIAQEYQKIFPNFVVTNAAGYLTVDSSPLTFYNTAGIQELARKLEVKDAEIAALKKQLAELESKAQTGEGRLASLEKLVRALTGGKTPTSAADKTPTTSRPGGE